MCFWHPAGDSENSDSKTRIVFKGLLTELTGSLAVSQSPEALTSSSLSGPLSKQRIASLSICHPTVSALTFAYAEYKLLFNANTCSG